VISVVLAVVVVNGNPVQAVHMPFLQVYVPAVLGKQVVDVYDYALTASEHTLLFQVHNYYF
jgi:DNA-binding protein Fis